MHLPLSLNFPNKIKVAKSKGNGCIKIVEVGG
jgi:hypothetical protein